MNFSLASPQESIYGSWGVLNDIDIKEPYFTTAPKYQALLDRICDDTTVKTFETSAKTKSFEISPNPTNGVVKIHTLNYGDEGFYLSLYEISGKLVCVYPKNSTIIDLNVQTGIYFLQIKNSKSTEVLKVIVVK
jgi:hypothetical protein